jgi:hypothetical protein
MNDRILCFTARDVDAPLTGAAVAAFVRRAPASMRELDLGPAVPAIALAWAIAETAALAGLERIKLLLVTGRDDGAGRDVLTALASRSMPDLVEAELAGDIDEALLAHLTDRTLRPALARLTLHPRQPLSPHAVARIRRELPRLELETELRGAAAVIAGTAAVVAGAGAEPPPT